MISFVNMQFYDLKSVFFPRQCRFLIKDAFLFHQADENVKLLHDARRQTCCVHHLFNMRVLTLQE